MTTNQTAAMVPGADPQRQDLGGVVVSKRNGRNPKSPAYQQYPADFLSDKLVAVMDAEEVGAYFLLLQYEWLDRGLENNVPLLAGLARVELERFRTKVWPKVGRCFKDRGDGFLINPRLQGEREAQAAGRARLKAASDAANAARWGARPDPVGIPGGSDSDSDRSPVGCDNVPPLSPIPYSLSPTPERRDARADGSVVPPAKIGSSPGANHPLPERVAAAGAAPAIEASRGSSAVPPPARVLRDPGRLPDVLPGAHKEARDFWEAEFLSATGHRYAYRPSRDGRILGEILEALSSDTAEFKLRARAMLLTPPAWVIERGGDIDLGTFLQCLNQVVVNNATTTSDDVIERRMRALEQTPNPGYRP